MAIKSYFFNAVLDGSTYDRTYTANDFTSYLKELVSNGVFINQSDNLQVVASSGLNAIVKAGSGWIDGHKIDNTAEYVVSFDKADVLLDRIDRVIFYTDSTERAMGITVLKGTAATNPVAPTLTRNETRYEMCLANVLIKKQATSITTANISDTRHDRTICGVVKGLIEEIDTTSIFNQYDYAFNVWFNEVKETLSTATLLRKFEATHYTLMEDEKVFDVKDYIPLYSSELDVLEIYVSSQRLTNIEYTRSGSIVTLNKALDVIGTAVSFVVYKSIDGSNAERIVGLVEELDTRVTALEGLNSVNSAFVLLNANDWSDVGNGEFIQTVSVPIVTSEDDVLLVSPVENVPVRATAQAVGSLTFTAYAKLSSNVSVNVVKLGV